jgi:hypothetical protein
MNLSLDLLLLALAAVLSLGLVVGLICLIIGVHHDDRAGLGSLPSGPCAQFARRVTGMHTIGLSDED